MLLFVISIWSHRIRGTATRTGAFDRIQKANKKRIAAIQFNSQPNCLQQKQNSCPRMYSKGASWALVLPVVLYSRCFGCDCKTWRMLVPAVTRKKGTMCATTISTRTPAFVLKEKRGQWIVSWDQFIEKSTLATLAGVNRAMASWASLSFFGIEPSLRVSWRYSSIINRSRRTLPNVCCRNESPLHSHG